MIALALAAAVIPLHGVFHVHWGKTECPAGTQASTSCYLNVGHGTVDGAGAATERYVLRVVFDASGCVHWRFPGTLLVPGRGTLRFVARNRGCFTPTQTDGTVYFTVTGGSGRFGGASGSGSIRASDSVETAPAAGTNTDTWKAQVVIP